MKTHIIVKFILVIFLIVLAFFVNKFVIQSENMQNLLYSLSYTGVFIISFASGFNFLVPIPAISFLPAFYESGLNIIISIFVITFGMTAGDMAGYLLGNMAKSFNENRNHKIIDKITRAGKKRSAIPILFLLLYASFAPLPNELIVIPLAFSGFRFMQIFPIVLIGNLVFNSIYAVSILNAFDVFLKIIGQ